MKPERCSRLLSWALLVLIVSTLTACSKRRTWTDNTGSFSIKAELYEVRPNSVVLTLHDGTKREVPMVRLSVDDRRYVSDAGLKGLPSKRASVVTSDMSSVPSYLREFYREMFSKDFLGAPGVVEFARFCAGLAPDSYKSIWAFPIVIIGSVPFLVGGAIWLLIRSFKDSLWKGVVMILLNFLTSAFMPLELLRGVFIFYLLFSNWSYFKGPVFFQGFGVVLILTGLLFAHVSLIPTN